MSDTTRADARTIVEACTHNVAIGCKAACAECVGRGIEALERKLKAAEAVCAALEVYAQSPMGVAPSLQASLTTWQATKEQEG